MDILASIPGKYYLQRSTLTKADALTNTIANGGSTTRDANTYTLIVSPHLSRDFIENVNSISQASESRCRSHTFKIL